MGYTTQTVDRIKAYAKVIINQAEACAASDSKYFSFYPQSNDIIAARETNYEYGHIILELRGGHWVDYKLNEVTE